MFIKTLKIKGYRTFNSEFTVKLNKGLNVLVGENATGKSTIIDAIRLILLEDEFGRTGIVDTDFHRPLSKAAKSKGEPKINIRCEFDKLSDEEQVIYLPWLDLNNPEKAILNLAIENKEDSRGKFKRKIWGNESESGFFEWELLNRINCIYLPALRDAEDKLKAFKGSRLSRLLKNLRTNDDEIHPLEKKFAALNKDLLNDESIKIANKFIKDNILKSVGPLFGQDTSLQFTQINFDRIVERIRLLFYPLLPESGTVNKVEMFRELNENSLGFNNILYLATILAEFDGTETAETSHKILLIEEPEAHLHPQLQSRLMQYLQEMAIESKIQIIVTTHSPALASSCDLNAVKILSLVNGSANPIFTAVADCCLTTTTKNFLERWLDITKSTLLFAKGVLFVEGIAEALVISEIAKMVLKEFAAKQPDKVYFKNLTDYGISIINLNGLYFNHFMAIFRGYKKDEDQSFVICPGIPVKCAGLTDNDPETTAKPTGQNTLPGKNHQLYLIAELIQQSVNCRLYSNLKTFEYDLALEGNNIVLMAQVQLGLIDTDGPVKTQLQAYSQKDWSNSNITDKADAAYFLLNHIDKGEFAQALSQRLSEPETSFAVPQYIKDALAWLVD
jgi:putative ATP-dependent endonuclease of OLD family